MSINHRSFSEVLHSPRIPIKEIALKEWAVVIGAIRQGEQILLVRKGGIVEETKEFRLEDTSFYLYPTYVHQKAECIRESYALRIQECSGNEQEVQIDTIAHVADDIELTDEYALRKLADYHILTDDYAEKRLRWKKHKPLHVLLIRAYKMNRSISLPVLEDYEGCKSWISLQQPIRDIDCSPVLDDLTFHEMRIEILRKLGLQREGS